MELLACLASAKTIGIRVVSAATTNGSRSSLKSSTSASASLCCSEDTGVSDITGWLQSRPHRKSGWAETQSPRGGCTHSALSSARRETSVRPFCSTIEVADREWSWPRQVRVPPDSEMNRRCDYLNWREALVRGPTGRRVDTRRPPVRIALGHHHEAAWQGRRATVCQNCVGSAPELLGHLFPSRSA